MFKIQKVHAREIIDSRATPTIEVDLYLEDGSMGRAAVPSGASTGVHEALELRDGDKDRYLGLGVLKATENVNETISKAIVGKDFDTQEALDSLLIELDGTENKSKLGANAILSVSLAFAHAAAISKKIPLYKYIHDLYPVVNLRIPSPMFNIMNGGRHANWATDIQEFMIMIPNETFAKQLEIASEIFLNLGKILDEAGLDTDVGHEGGYAPGFKSNEEAFKYITMAVEKSGVVAGKDVFFAIDVAANEFYDEKKGTYYLKAEKRELTKKDLGLMLEDWINKYPLTSIEDPFVEDDWSSWKSFTEKFGTKIQIVGDDLLVTNVKRIEKAVDEKACNALLVKVNQIGTLTETLHAMQLSLNAGWHNIVSHRSGETEDVTISHLAVGTGCGQIKTGAPSRGERTAKFNELLRIEEEIGDGK